MTARRAEDVVEALENFVYVMLSLYVLDPEWTYQRDLDAARRRLVEALAAPDGGTKQ